MTPVVSKGFRFWPILLQKGCLKPFAYATGLTADNRFKELRRRGVPKFNAAVTAGSPTGFWRMSSHPAVQMSLRNHVFDSLGLPRLHVLCGGVNSIEPP